jgi:3-deoxy-7-phosphoheptulonate synthase
MLLLIDAAADLEAVRAEVTRRGAACEALRSADGARALRLERAVPVAGIPGVVRVLEAPSPHPLADAAPRAVRVGDALIGGPAPVLIAGPCAAEGEAQVMAAAAAAAEAGASVLRGGAWKPRTSPHAFQGLGLEGLRLLRRAADRHWLALATEALAVDHVPLVAEHADMIQVGARSMQAFDLLRAVGRAGRPVLLKRGLAATLEEWLLAAEHLLAAGAPAVVLCERGIRTFETATRFTLDLGAVAALVAARSLPVIVDPSHAAGRRDLVRPLARAALAAGAHGLLVEAHADPGGARCDGAQALAPEDLLALGRECGFVGEGSRTPPAPPRPSPLGGPSVPRRVAAGGRA